MRAAIRAWMGARGLLLGGHAWRRPEALSGSGAQAGSFSSHARFNKRESQPHRRADSPSFSPLLLPLRDSLARRDKALCLALLESPDATPAAVAAVFKSCSAGWAPELLSRLESGTIPCDPLVAEAMCRNESLPWTLVDRGMEAVLARATEHEKKRGAFSSSSSQPSSQTSSSPHSPSLIPWTSWARRHADAGNGAGVRRILTRMREIDPAAERFRNALYAFLLRALCTEHRVSEALSVLGEVEAVWDKDRRDFARGRSAKTQTELTPRQRPGSFQEAMLEPSDALYRSAAVCLAQHGRGVEAEALLERMLARDIRPTLKTLGAVVDAVLDPAGGGGVDSALDLARRLVDRGMDLDDASLTRLAGACARAGRVGAVENLARAFPGRDAGVWGGVFGAAAAAGDVALATQALALMPGEPSVQVIKQLVQAHARSPDVDADAVLEIEREYRQVIGDRYFVYCQAFLALHRAGRYKELDDMYRRVIQETGTPPTAMAAFIYAGAALEAWAQLKPVSDPDTLLERALHAARAPQGLEEVWQQRGSNVVLDLRRMDPRVAQVLALDALVALSRGAQDRGLHLVAGDAPRGAEPGFTERKRILKSALLRCLESVGLFAFVPPRNEGRIVLPPKSVREAGGALKAGPGGRFADVEEIKKHLISP